MFAAAVTRRSQLALGNAAETSVITLFVVAFQVYVTKCKVEILSMAIFQVCLPKSASEQNSLLLQVTFGRCEFFGFLPPSIHSRSPLSWAISTIYNMLTFSPKNPILFYLNKSGGKSIWKYNPNPPEWVMGMCHQKSTKLKPLWVPISHWRLFL